MRSVTNRYKNLGEEGGSGLPRYVKENIKFLLLSNKNFNVFTIYSFDIASKYPNVITVVSSCTQIAIILAFIYVGLLLKVLNFSMKSLRNGGGRGQAKIDSSLESVTQEGGGIKRPFQRYVLMVPKSSNSNDIYIEEMLLY